MNEEIMINVDKYKPTSAEQRLLEVLLNPESAGKSVTQKCQMAQISRETYYNCMEKTKFTDLLYKTSVDLVKEKVSDILTATLKFAQNDARCHQDRRILLEMAGIYKDKRRLEIEPVPITFEDELYRMRNGIPELDEADIDDDIEE